MNKQKSAEKKTQKTTNSFFSVLEVFQKSLRFWSLIWEMLVLLTLCQRYCIIPYKNKCTWEVQILINHPILYIPQLSKESPWSLFSDENKAFATVEVVQERKETLFKGFKNPT